MKRILFTASQVAVAAFLTLAAAQCTLVQADEIYDWSNTAANNNNAPPDGFPENMNYSEVNDAARELMAVVKRYVEAIDGTNTTGGTQPTYTLSSGQSLSAGAAGRVHVWTAHASSTGAVTLNVDAAGAKNVVDAGGTQLGSGGVVSGGVYMTVETGSAHRVIGSIATTPVAGPASSTDNAVARFNGAGGVTIQNSGVIIDDSDNITGIGTLSSGAITSSGSLSGTSLALSSTVTGATTVDIGNADTTLSRASAGNVSIEGNAIYRAGGTDVPVTDGGNGRSTATAYAVITGGTTATGAHQSVSGVGTDGQVLTSNGASALPTWRSSPGALVAIIEDQQTAGTDGASLATGADRTRVLNTLTYNRASTVSLSSDQFTLPAGDWFIKWAAPAGLAASPTEVVHQTILRNVTDNSDVARGTVAVTDMQSGGDELVNNISEGSAVVTIASSKAFEIRHRVSNSAVGGRALSAGTEVYTRVEIHAN